jgi:hypothetical protein
MICASMLPEWNIHYDDWIIGDGEPDRDVGDIFEWFALAFWPDGDLKRVEAEGTKSAIPMDNYKYRVVAEVVFLSQRACIIDFGLRAAALAGSVPAGCKVGDYVTGNISLRLPLCTEFGPEEVAETPAYTWEVNRISADLTPYVAHSDNPRFFVRDDSRIRYEEVVATYSVKACTYILHCSQIPTSHSGR